ncbi:MAG: branched-chain amino acid ABC transporter permease [Desulfitobacteriaceae bacterium]
MKLMKFFRSAKYTDLILFALILALVPLFLSNKYILGVLNQIGIYTIVVVGLCLLIGYAGQISFGHAAFYGLGAYTSGILSLKLNISPWLGLPAAGILAGLVALVIGIPTLKLKHHFLALATLGFGIILGIFFIELTPVTGGPSGLLLSSFQISGKPLKGEVAPFYLIWAFVMVSMWLSKNLVRSRNGLALRAIKGSEVAAQSMGINAAKLKLQVFVFSAVLTGISGALYGHYIGFISPNSFDPLTSVLFVVMAVVGGPESIWGAVIGTALMVSLTEILRAVIPLVLPNSGGQYEVIVYGALLIITLIFLPGGLSSLPGRFKHRIRIKAKADAQTMQVTPE